MKNFTICSAAESPFIADILLPGDKSISHRAVIFASLANGVSRLEGFLESEDCLSTVSAMRQLGISIRRMDHGILEIEGKGGVLTAPNQDINCGNSGTTMRLLSGVLATQPFLSRLVGDESLSKRPMKRIIDPLCQMGSIVQGSTEKLTPPITIDGRNRKFFPISYHLPVSSSQVKSAILLAALSITGTTEVIDKCISRDHTERLLPDFGVQVNIQYENQGSRISITGPQKLCSHNFCIPCDISSASFWLVAGLARPGSKISIDRVSINPTRLGIVDVLRRMGGTINITPSKNNSTEPCGRIDIVGSQLHGTIIQGSEIPNVIDELPILAIAGALAQGKTVIKDASELRFKETDRIRALAKNLTLMGISVVERPDGIEIEGGKILHGTSVSSFGDHRIAMSFAIAGLFAKGITTIENVESVNTSYPDFEKTLQCFLNAK